MSEKNNGRRSPAVTADPTQTHVTIQLKYGSPLIRCRFDRGGRFVFASAEDNSVQRFDIGAGKPPEPTAFLGHGSWVWSMETLPDGERLVTGGCDGVIGWWPARAESPSPLRLVKAHDGWVRSLAVSPDGTLIASGGNDKLVKIWNGPDGDLIRTIGGHQSHIYSLLFHPGGEFLLSGDLMGSVRQWEIRTGKLVREFDVKALHTYNGGQGVHYGGVRSLDVSPDTRLLACAGLHKASNPLGAVNEPIVVLLDWETGKQRKALVTEGVKGGIWRAIFHPDGYLVGASGGSGGGVLLFWKVDTEKAFHSFKLPNTTRDLDLHPDGLRLATAHHDRHVRITNMTPKPQESQKKDSPKKKSS